ncbi:putative Organic cation transporter protein-like 29, partial [Homarus americanus]
LTSLQTRAERLTACFATKLITRARESDVKNGLLRAVNLNRDVFNKKTRLLCAADAVSRLKLKDTILSKGLDTMSPDFSTPAPWESLPTVFNILQTGTRKADCIQNLDTVNGVGVESPDVIAANWKKKVKEESVDVRNSKQDSRNDSTFVSPFQAISYQFLGATPNYWCHVVPLVDANWTNEEILDFAIPSSSCRRKFVFIDSKVSVTALEWKTNSLPICACRGIEFY